MKAILVIDEMPKNCDECPLLRWSSIDGWNCTPMNRIAEDDKPEWCPLKPLPKPKPTTKADSTYDPWEDTYRRGWNACLEALEDSRNGEDSNK